MFESSSMSQTLLCIVENVFSALLLSFATMGATLQNVCDLISLSRGKKKKWFG